MERLTLKNVPRAALSLYALCQTHRYGQSICAEVLAPNKVTAEKIFERDLQYSGETHGRFYVAKLYMPTDTSMFPYLKPYEPRKLRMVCGIVSAADPSPFGPPKSVEPLVFTKPSAPKRPSPRRLSPAQYGPGAVPVSAAPAFHVHKSASRKPVRFPWRKPKPE